MKDARSNKKGYISMGRMKLEQKEKQRTQDIFSKDVKLTDKLLMVKMFRSFFSLGIVDVGKELGDVLFQAFVLMALSRTFQ